MENKANYIYAINFINSFHTRQNEGNLKYQAKYRKLGLPFIYIEPKCESHSYLRSLVNH